MFYRLIPTNGLQACLMLFLFFCNNCVFGRKLELAELFRDHMVLQQGISCPIWGLADKGQDVSVFIENKLLKVKADSTGKWFVKLPVYKGGGPYHIVVKSSNDEIVIEDVMFGEVWLASGQSNMNFSIDRPIVNKEETISDAHYPMIRMLTVEPSVSSYPNTKLNSKGWVVCSPESVGSFSAVAYFFARKLYKEKKVTVGIIHSSYSGSPAEAWLSKNMLMSDSGFRKLDLSLNEKEDWAQLQEEGRKVTQTYNEIVKGSTAGLDSGLIRLDYNDKHWKKATYPIVASQLNIPGYRLIWLRKTIILDRKPEGDFVLKLGEIKMRDRTYINGVLIGQQDKEQTRTYTIPAGILKKGENVIVIRWLSEWGYGRVGNPTDIRPIIKSLSSGEEILLSGEWKYNSSIEPELRIGNTYHRNPSAIFNAMIAPVAGYGIKGFLWYQGESNAGRASEYSRLLQLLIKDWRNRWEQGSLPFLIVQLPNYTEGGEGWVRLREAQADVVANTNNTTLVPTIDLGDADDLHPKNKQPVGERLYTAASKLVYKDKVIATGPIFKKMYYKNGCLYLEFSNNGGFLKAKGNLDKAFVVAGTNQKFQPAKAQIIGNRVILSSNILNPVAVRYNWEANPTSHLCNASGLPAFPFRTDIWKY